MILVRSNISSAPPPAGTPVAPVGRALTPLAKASRTLLIAALVSKGLTIKPSAPTRRLSSSSKSSRIPMSNKTGVLFRAGSFFNSSHTSKPFFAGISMSAIITLGFSILALAKASSPLLAKLRVNSSGGKVLSKTFWMVVLSSAIRSFAGTLGPFLITLSLTSPQAVFVSNVQ